MIREINPKKINRHRIRKTFDDPTNTEILILLYLKTYEDHEIDNKFLAALCGVDRRIVRRSISNLIKRGWISHRGRRARNIKRSAGCGVLRYDIIRQIPQNFWDEFSEEI